MYSYKNPAVIPLFQSRVTLLKTSKIDRIQQSFWRPAIVLDKVIYILKSDLIVSIACKGSCYSLLLKKLFTNPIVYNLLSKCNNKRRQRLSSICNNRLNYCYRLAIFKAYSIQLFDFYNLVFAKGIIVLLKPILNVLFYIRIESYICNRLCLNRIESLMVIQLVRKPRLRRGVFCKELSL